MISVAGGNTSPGEVKFRYPPTAKLAESLGIHGANSRRDGSSASVTTERIHYLTSHFNTLTVANLISHISHLNQYNSNKSLTPKIFLEVNPSAYFTWMDLPNSCALALVESIKSGFEMYVCGSSSSLPTLNCDV